MVLLSVGASLILLRQTDHGQQRSDLNKADAVVLIVLSIVLAGMLTFTAYAVVHQTTIIQTRWGEELKDSYLMMASMDENNPFYTKKVIIRDDDVGNATALPAVRWIATRAEDDIKVTFAIIPAELAKYPETAQYLNTLDRSRVEFATHGYAHESFFPLSYEEQSHLIGCGTAIIEDLLNYRPTSFVPPKSSGNVDTSRAARMHGYAIITDMTGYPCYLTNFISSFEYESSYSPPMHRSYEDFFRSFDEFNTSSEEFYLIYLHDWSFLDEGGRLNATRTEQFDQIIRYLTGKNVQFMTLREAYYWQIDKPAIRTGQIDDSTYFIDLQECRYSHLIPFRSENTRAGAITVTDVSPDQTPMRCDVERSGSLTTFQGEQGHLYIVETSDGR
ncbi:polysaccharide deacetylase family protein [Methanofollis fontis]|nr:DUF2334 domain-containing protein [Methanofollis fontis]